MDSAFRVIAIIAAFNEGDIISPVIGHLVENGIDVYLMDNHSTDDTVAEARQWLGRGLIDIEQFPSGSNAPVEACDVFDWTAILRRKEELAAELEADWFIHHDADEIREGPWPATSLRDAIQWVDRVGYNCIDFRTLSFPPIDDGFKKGDDPRTYFRFYEGVADFDIRQVKCWKAQAAPVALVPSGGHDVSFAGRRVFPIPFILRHYPVRGQSHGLRKVLAERKSRLLEHEHSMGWHIQYDHVESETHQFLKSPSDLSPFDLDRVRLDIMLPDRVLRDLLDRLLRADADLLELRVEREGLARGLDEYRRHATNLEAVREQSEQRVADLEEAHATLRTRIADLDGERSALSARVVDVERGLEEYKRHATDLERVREELERHVADLARQLDVRTQDAGDLERQVADLTHQLDVRTRNAGELERRLEDSTRTVSELERGRDAMQREIAGLRTSRSWRWTAPLRRLVDALGGR